VVNFLTVIFTIDDSTASDKNHHVEKRRRLLFLLAGAVLLVGTTLFTYFIQARKDHEQAAALLRSLANQPYGNIEAEEFQCLGVKTLPKLVAMMTPPSRTRQKLTEWAQALQKTPLSRLVPSSLAKEPDPLRAWHALYGFQLLGPEAAPAIPSLEHLARHSKDRPTGDLAIMALLIIGTNAVPAVQRLMATPERLAQAIDMIILEEYNPQAEPILSALTQGPAAAAVFTELGRLCKPAPISTVTNALQNPDALIRQTAATWLLWHHEPAETRQAIGPLVHCLHDPDKAVQTTALCALRAVAPEMFVTNSAIHRLARRPQAP
jgi:hypothetical protein